MTRASPSVARTLYESVCRMYESKAFIIQAEFHGTACSYESKAFIIYMQGSMALASPGVARTLYEPKAFIIHAGFHGTGYIVLVLLGHCMSRKPSLYMQCSMALLVWQTASSDVLLRYIMDP